MSIISMEWDWFTNMLNRIKKLIYYRMHPEAAIRYYPIVKLLKKLKLQNSQILEVGSGSYGITPYLKKNITGVDMSFDEPEYQRLKQVIGSAEKLPFKNNQFAVVILSDVLEHLPKTIRDHSLKEAIRVARKAVIVSGPFGEKAAKQDQELADYSLKKTGQMHDFFKDHLEYGLPEVKDVQKLSKLGKVKKVKIIGEYFNLGVRKMLMHVYITNNKLIYYFYLKGLMPFIPLLRTLNIKPCYRTVILLEVK